jgi:phage terminase large subunit
MPQTNSPVKVRANIVFKHLQEVKETTSIIVEQGGSRSGKTYNILTWLISMASTSWDNQVIDIVRKSFPSLRSSVMFDFFQILNNLEMYTEKHHNKTENIYKIGSNTFRFFSCDDPQKMRGPGRDFLFCNEANELKLEDFRQLNMRTRKLTILDYNPSEEFHWIYDYVLTREDVEFYRTTFMDNPFLDKRIKKEILRYRDTDENYWRIYGLGERGISQTSIYTKWDTCEEIPQTDNVFYGLDFGFNHPTALVKITLDENTAYIEELLYESHLVGEDIINRLKSLEIPSSAPIYADCARPELIHEIGLSGFNIYPVKKGADSVKEGIDYVKRHKLMIHQSSVNVLKEIRSYKWRVDKDERILDEPVKLNDDAMDAMRYAFNELLQGGDAFGEVISFNF